MKYFSGFIAFAALGAGAAAAACGTDPGAPTATPPDDPRVAIGTAAKADPLFAAFGAGDRSSLAVEAHADGDHRVSRGCLVAHVAATGDGPQQFSLGDGPRFRVTMRLEDAAPVAALADPTRRAILAELTGGDATVTQLTEPLPISMPAVSRHLKVLEGAALISRARDGKWQRSHLEAASLQEASAWIERFRGFWDTSFDRLDAYLAAQQGDAVVEGTKQRRGLNLLSN